MEYKSKMETLSDGIIDINKFKVIYKDESVVDNICNCKKKDKTKKNSLKIIIKVKENLNNIMLSTL